MRDLENRWSRKVAQVAQIEVGWMPENCATTTSPSHREVGWSRSGAGSVSSGAIHGRANAKEMKMDIAINEAMICWNAGKDVKVVRHPDKSRQSDDFRSSVGACFTDWREMDMRGQKLQLMIDAWHIAAFDKIPAADVHQALLVIPEYRSMLADDCLPEKYRGER